MTRPKFNEQLVQIRATMAYGEKAGFRDFVRKMEGNTAGLTYTKLEAYARALEVPAAVLLMISRTVADSRSSDGRMELKASFDAYRALIDVLEKMIEEGVPIEPSKRPKNVRYLLDVFRTKRDTGERPPNVNR